MHLADVKSIKIHKNPQTINLKMTKNREKGFFSSKNLIPFFTKFLRLGRIFEVPYFQYQLIVRYFASNTV